MKMTLAENALSIWNSNPMRRHSHCFALFGPDGQYHGAFTTAADAGAEVKSLEDTEAWIGDGYQVIKFR